MRQISILLLLAVFSLPVAASTAITYQGKLNSSGTPFTGAVAMEFQLYDAASGGSPVGPSLSRTDVAVQDGLFQVDLDFGQVYSDTRWLEITVEGTTLDARQRIAPAPMAIRAETLDGLDSTDFLGASETAADSDLLDGLDSSDFQVRLKRTIVISPTGDPVADGATLINTVSGIADATQSSPVRVLIEPGTYTLDQTLFVPPNVYVEGSGQGATRITRTGNPEIFLFTIVDLSASSAISRLSVLGFGAGSGRIRGVAFGDAGEARIHRLTVSVRNADSLNYPVYAIYSGTGSSTLFVSETTVLAEGGERAVGIQAPFDAALNMRAVTITATGASELNQGVSARGADSRLTDSQITSDGTGVQSDGGNLVGRDCEIFGQATGVGGKLRIHDSRIEGVTNRAVTGAGGESPFVASSQIIGDVVGATCVASYDENYLFFAEGCP